MAGINIRGKKKTEAAKLLSHIASYMFEQEYDELKGHSDITKALTEAMNKLKQIT